MIENQRKQRNYEVASSPNKDDELPITAKWGDGCLTPNRSSRKPQTMPLPSMTLHFDTFKILKKNSVSTEYGPSKNNLQKGRQGNNKFRQRNEKISHQHKQVLKIQKKIYSFGKKKK